MKQEQARELNDQAVKHLVDAHARLDEQLLLAIRFKVNDAGIHLLEVLDGFPGAEADEPLETEFGPSPGVRMVGNLKLALVNPAQFRALAVSGSALCKAVTADGRVEYAVGEGRDLAELLQLPNVASTLELNARKELVEEDGTTLSNQEREELKKAWG